MACKKKYADGGIVRRPTPSVATESDPWRDMYVKPSPAMPAAPAGAAPAVSNESTATESDPWRDMYPKKYADGGFVDARHNPDNRLPRTASHKGRGHG